MTNLKRVTMQLELSFWSLTIRLLSESRLLRALLPMTARLLQSGSYQPGVRIILLCSGSGFLLGLILGVLSIL